MYVLKGEGERMLLRIFFGDRCQDVTLDPTKKFAIGKKPKNGFAVDAADLLDEHIVFKPEKGAWSITCMGDVYCGDQHYDRKNPYPGEPEAYKRFLLSAGSRVSCLVLPEEVRQTTFDLSPYDEITVGRKSGSNIALKFGLVSGEHAVIRKSGNSFELTDDKSTNGTYLNGVRTASAVLKNGDTLAIGEATLVFRNGTLDIRSNFCAVSKPVSRQHDPLTEVVRFERSPRLKLVPPQGQVEIQPPPPQAAKPNVNWLQVFLPAMGTVGAGLAVTLLSGMNPMMLAFSAPMAIIGIIISITNYRRQSKIYRQQQQKRLETYTEYLDSVVREIEKKRGEQTLALTSADPSTAACVNIARTADKTLWDRRPSDADFMSFRLGSGDLPLSVDIKFPQRGFAMEEDPLQSRPAEIYETYRTLRGMPVVCSAQRCPIIGVTGTPESTSAFLSSVIVQLATHHSYNEVKFILFCDEGTLAASEWVKRLPHFYDEERKTCYIASNKREAAKLCGLFEKSLKERRNDRDAEDQYDHKLRIPFLVFLVAAPSLLEGEPIRRYLYSDNRDLGISTIMLYEQVASLPKECGTIVELRAPLCEFYSKERASERVKFSMDTAEERQYREFAQAMGNIICEENSAEEGVPRNVSFFDMLGIRGAEELDLERNWRTSDVTRSLAAPLGVKEKNELVLLDLHENAHGPHGLVAGTTGSGKSEVLQSYVLAMAAAFHPYEVGFVVIDFKGGGMVNQFRDLPHLIGAITDMDGREVNRSLLSIKAELDKRKRLFAEHKVNKIDQYIALCKSGQAQEPLPHLIIIVDEFAELKADQPEFMQELISAARIGRSLGVHLILATQKPAGQVNEQIWSNSKFKLCLKVQDANDSKEVLKSPLAAKIKDPGRAYLKVGNDEIFELFQSGYSGVKTRYDGEEVTQLTAVVRHIAAFCSRAGIRRLPPICLPSLPGELAYPEGLEMMGKNLVPIGRYDDPSMQRQGTVLLNLDENTFILGSAQTGKTNLIQSLIRTVAWNTAPSQVNLYIMDFGSMTLKSFETLRHVGGVVLPDEDEKLKNLFKLLDREVEERKKRMIAVGVSSFQAYLEGGYTDIPRILLILDGFSPFRELYGEEYEGVLQHICRDGLAYGITAVVTNTQTGGFGYKYLSLFAQRFAFSCNDATEFSNLFPRCRLEPTNIRGRFLCRMEEAVLEAQAFLAFQGKKEIERAVALKAFVEAANSRWPEERAQPIPAIPQELTQAYIARHYNRPLGRYEYVVGLDYAEVDTVTYDLGAISELAVAGASPEKKGEVTGLLLSLMTGRRSGAPVSLYIVDSVERPLKRFKDSPCTETYTIDFAEAGTVIDELCREMERRYDVLVKESVEALDRCPLLAAVFNNRSVIEFISANRDVLEKYRRIIKQAKSLKILFLFSDLEAGSVSFGAPELMKSMKTLKNAIITDNLKEVQLFDLPPAVVRGSKQLQKNDVFCMVDGNVKRTRMCEELP